MNVEVLSSGAGRGSGGSRPVDVVGGSALPPPHPASVANPKRTSMTSTLPASSLLCSSLSSSSASSGAGSSSSMGSSVGATLLRTANGSLKAPGTRVPVAALQTSCPPGQQGLEDDVDEDTVVPEEEVKVRRRLKKSGSGRNNHNNNNMANRRSLSLRSTAEQHHYQQQQQKNRMSMNNNNNNFCSPRSVSPDSVSSAASSSAMGTAVNRLSKASSSKNLSSRKVSINETPLVMVSKVTIAPLPRQSQSQLNGGGGAAAQPQQQQQQLEPLLEQQLQHRASLIEVSERKAKKVRFFINADKFFKGATIAVSDEKFRTFDRLLEHLSRIMCNQAVTLPHGVRYIFALDGRAVERVEELSHGENYVCSSAPSYRRLDYLRMAQEQDQLQMTWKGMKRDNYYTGMGMSSITASGPSSATGVAGRSRRDEFKMTGHSKSFRVTKIGGAGSERLNLEDQQRMIQFKPKIIAVLKCGLKPRKAVRVLLNNRNTKSLETVLADLTSVVKLDSGAVRKVFTLDGKPVVVVGDFADSEVFIAYGLEKCSNEDFDLDLGEFRNVQAILKSPDLDAKYEKFAGSAPSSSPRNGRRKFFQGRSGRNRRGRKSPSKSRESPRNSVVGTAASAGGTGSARGQTGGSSSNVSSVMVAVNGSSSSSSSLGVVGSSLLPPLTDIVDTPAQVSVKYIVGEIIGDGNFAVVRRCVSRRTKQAFALKVIDKSKCQGKEHMIESEIAILNLVSHPHIIELIEVFDFPQEKYLVTELVPGGDLFDAIASDVRYSEPVSRRMICDLTSALQYLHDKMIVHRDIKPENLLVINLPPQPHQQPQPRRGQGGLENGSSSNPEYPSKSLKLGDFGLAQVVSEPLFTVCGTPTYVAPEILAETGYGVKVDVWATGVIMYILLVGFPPFSSRTNNQEELFDQILSGLFEFNSPDWDDISYPAKELISWMLQVDPLQRYSAYEILQHPWLRDSRV